MDIIETNFSFLLIFFQLIFILIIVYIRTFFVLTEQQQAPFQQLERRQK